MRNDALKQLSFFRFSPRLLCQQGTVLASGSSWYSDEGSCGSADLFEASKADDISGELMGLVPFTGRSNVLWEDPASKRWIVLLFKIEGCRVIAAA